MVSGVKVWDPLHAGLIHSRLSEGHLGSALAPPCALIRRAAEDSASLQSQNQTTFSSTPFTLIAAEPHHSPVLSDRAKANPQTKRGEGKGVTRRLEMKGKRHCNRGDAVMEDRPESMADGAKNAKITLSFPVSAGPLPASLTSSSYCRNAASSSSPHRRRPSYKSSDEGSLWKLDSTMDVKHRPFKPQRHDSSPSSSPSSSSSPMTVHALIRKDIKSPPPLKCSKLSPETQFHKSAGGCSSSALAGSYAGDGWDERHKTANGAASPSQTAQILFSLGTSAYPRGGGDAERKAKITGRPAGKLGSPRGPSLHPPALHLPPPLPPPPPPPSEGLTAPPHSSSYSPTDSLKPELICGVCHRLFSSASSLTVHMRLHRGSRALSCRFCGKVFIHSKRLQSHEASCRVPGLPSRMGPSLAVQPKEEPLEEGEVRVEEAEMDMSKARPEKKAGCLLACVQGDDDAAATELLASDESHFVKVVDGNVIYFCSVCERSYMTLSSLKRHSNVHSWRRRYPCHYCDKVFALAEYRTKHEVWHTGERRYQCIFCWDAFATYYNLKTHQKTIHGINPSLISSEKTANGGYKQKANALKLYRLLPMRSQKRPYKTYSDTLHNGLLMSPAEAPSLSLPGLGCALGPGDLPSFIGGNHPQSVKPDPDGLSDDILIAEHNHSGSPLFPQPDSPQLKKHDEAPELELHRGGSKMSSSGKAKTHKMARDTDSPSMPSVITYGRTKPSVIVHGTAVSSSVIVHSNQLSPGSEQNKPSEINVSQTSHKVSARSLKRQRDGADSHQKRSRDSSDPTRQNAETDGSCFKSRKSHSKNDLSKPKQPSPSVDSLVKETGPLCQITVRIGEEAIVKRSISETDLRRDKSHSPPKNKRGEASSVKAAQHHKHHVHRRASQGQEEDKGGDSKEEVGENMSNSCDELREYNFRQKVREQESDHDTEDNLWRPYYSYKPKKKAQAHLQRFKSWQRKLKFKRALRLKRRAEKLKKSENKEIGKSQDEEEEDEEGGKPSEADKAGCEREDKQLKEASHERSAPSAPSPKPPLATSIAATGLKRRPWTNGNAAECATCGCWFSSTSKRDQHELSHLLEFVCLFCRATFPSRDKLEGHQRIQHPKPADISAAVQKVPLGEHPNVVKPEYGDEKQAQVNLSNSSPPRLSRRALSRHTCPQCHKVCKTSSALSRHIRRHEFTGSPERTKEDDGPEPQATAESKDKVCEKGKVVSVISYLTADPPKSADSSSSPDHHSEPTSQHWQAESGDKPEVAERTYLESETKLSPKISESPVNLAPTKAQPPVSTPPNLQTVLVMNGPECLDFCTPGKRNPDKMASPVHGMVNPRTSANVPVLPQTRITTAAPPVSVGTANSSDRGVLARDGVIMDRERQARSGMLVRGSYQELPLVQALRVQSLSRSPSPNEAQDLTMSSILARERETERQRLQKRALEKRRERGRDKDQEKDMERVQHLSRHEQTTVDQTTLLVPKEEPLSPVPSPQHIPTITTTNGPLSHRHTPKSPCRPGLLAGANQQIQELDRLTLPNSGDRPSAHALLLPRAPKPPEPERHNAPRDGQHVEPAPVCYPVQDYPLPLLVPDTYQPNKKQEDNLLVSSFPAGALPFGPLGKMMVPNAADLAKLPFYPDPYQLLYGSQFLAYPYNVAALPVALNMMAPGADKVEPLPFLPAIFNYTAGAGPYMGAPPHPLVAKPSFYGGGKKQRDGSSNKP